MKTQKMPMTISFDEVRLQQLKDPKWAQYALNLALREFEQDNDVPALLETLRLIAQAQGGLASLARRTEVSRQALNEALSSRGNPRLKTFQGVLEALGLRMSLKPAKVSGRAHRVVWGSNLAASHGLKPVSSSGAGAKLRKTRRSSTAGAPHATKEKFRTRAKVKTS